MSTTTTDPTAAVKAQAEQIVTSGTDIRPRLAEVIAQNAWRPQRPGGLIELIQAVTDGAREGLAKSVPQDRDDVLRQVVDALTDGLSRTALAGQLALDEAASAFRQYTAEDLSRFSHDLRAVHDLFTETVDRGLTTAKALTTAQVAAARTHIGRVAERLRTELKVLNDHVREHPEAFARESLRAGASMGRCAAGSLFEAIGRMLSRAGEQMTREGESSSSGGAAARTKTKGKA
jgi:hypothetical protein